MNTNKNIANVNELEVQSLNAVEFDKAFNNFKNAIDIWKIVHALKPAMQPKNYTTDIWVKCKDASNHIVYAIVNVSRKDGSLLNIKDLRTTDIAFNYAKMHLSEFTNMSIQ